MPDVHARFAATATRLIARHGRTMQLLTETASGPDYNPTITTTSEDIKAVQTRFESSEVDGELVKSNDIALLVDSTVPISNEMRAQDGSTVYSVAPVLEVKPGTTSILYKLRARV